MKITIAAVGKMKSPPLLSVINDYLKRIPWNITILEVEEKRPFNPEKLKEAEGELLLKSADKNAYIIALDENGKSLRSLEFAGKLKEISNSGISDIILIIGGANGLSENILNSADFKLSLGKMTWPHMLVRVMLAEQLYRAYSVITNHPYHRE